MSYTSDKKPLELTALTSLATDDTIIVGDTSDTSEVVKSITKANLITDLSNSFIAEDANGNATAVNFIEGYTTTVNAAGTTTLTVASNYKQYFTGSSNQTVALPVATTLVNGQSFQIVNTSTGAVTVQTSGGNTLIIVAGGTSAIVTCINTAGGTGTASWSSSYLGHSISSGKKVTLNNTMVFSGTDNTTMTFPSTTATIGRTDAAQTFTGTQTYSNAVNYTNNAITASGNAATVPITARVHTVTNNSAATLTITMTTGAVDGQLQLVRILDFSAVAQTITWVNTENSTVTAPTTSNGSTTLPLTVGFQYNNATSKWRCIASA